MAQTVKVKTESKYMNHSVKANKSIDILFKMPYSELSQYIQTIQMLNENVTLAGKIGSDKKPLLLGTFMVNNINVDRDGEGKIKFNSQLDYVESENINELANRNEEPLVLLMKADIELEEDQEDEDLPEE